MLYQLSYLGMPQGPGKYPRANEPAVYSGAGLPCPPAFACGFGAAGPTLVPGQIIGKSVLFDAHRPGASPPRPSIFQPDLRVADHRAPFVGLRLQEGGELGLRRAFRHRAKVLEARFHRRGD